MPLQSKPLPAALNRRFGVEIECGVPGKTYGTVLSSILSEKNGFSKGWYGKSDGSGVEVCTPILKGREGFDELKRAYEALNKAGAFVSIADGMHVHHEVAELKTEPERAIVMLREWVTHHDAIYEMIAPWRHGSSMCRPWTMAQVNKLKVAPRMEYVYKDGSYRGVLQEVPNTKELHGIDSGYKDLTFRMPYRESENPRIEVRLHEGTLDYEAAEAWIQFVQRFLHRALKQDVEPLGAAERAALLSKLRMPQKLQDKVAAKIADGHITPVHKGTFDRKATGHANIARDGIEGVYNERID